MAIPDDVEQRWWVEVSDSNPAHVDELRSGLLVFVAFTSGGEANIVGSGFVIAGDPRYAVAMTAKHVLSEGVLRTQRPYPRHAPSAVVIPKSSITPSIEPKDLKVFWMGTKNALAMDLVHVEYNDSLDAACCILVPQELDEGSFNPISLPIDVAVPCVGDVVHMVSQDGLSASTDKLDHARRIQLTRRMSVRVGVVTAVHPKGYRQYRWPCFTTSIPAEPGMSGGLVVLPVEGKTIAACGIVCADNSSDGARTNHNERGESVVACTWATLGMGLPESFSAQTIDNRRSLFEFMQSGKMPMAIGGIDSIDIHQKENGDYAIRRR